MEYFGEDAVVSMGKYYLRKNDKDVVKRGSKRAIESSAKRVPTHNQFIWNSDIIDVHEGALDTSASMGVFVGENFDLFSQLCLSLGDKEKELQKSKLDLVAA